MPRVAFSSFLNRVGATEESDNSANRHILNGRFRCNGADADRRHMAGSGLSATVESAKPLHTSGCCFAVKAAATVAPKAAHESGSYRPDMPRGKPLLQAPERFRPRRQPRHNFRLLYT